MKRNYLKMFDTIKKLDAEAVALDDQLAEKGSYHPDKRMEAKRDRLWKKADDMKNMIRKDMENAGYFENHLSDAAAVKTFAYDVGILSDDRPYDFDIYLLGDGDWC